ncbi:MAG: hypothetical protein ACYC6Y_11910 [Thermoguttaceae bacterium]
MLTPVGWQDGVSTGWLPLDSDQGVPIRPVPLLPIGDPAPQPQYADPMPRYGANAAHLDQLPAVDDTPLLAAVEPAQQPPVNLIDEMFSPPGPHAVEPALADLGQVAPENRDSAVLEPSVEPTQDLPGPLPTPDSGDGELVAPILAVPDLSPPLPPADRAPESAAQLPSAPSDLALPQAAPDQPPLPLPPLEAEAAVEPLTPGDVAGPQLPAMPDAAAGGLFLPLAPVDAQPPAPSQSPDQVAGSGGPDVLADPIGGVLVPLPPVDAQVAADVPPAGAQPAGSPLPGQPLGPFGYGPQDVAAGDLLVPLPPVLPAQVASAPQAEPAPIPLPPIDRSPVSTPASTSAVRLIEGLFEPVAAQPARGIRSQLTEHAESAGDAPAPLDSATADLAAPESGDQQLGVFQPLPPVERLDEATQLSPSAGPDQSTPAADNPRSWELELIAQEADEHSRRAFGLAGKKAHFAARLEFTRALRIVAQGLDTQQKTNRHSLALAAGLRALTEAEDFLPGDRHLEAELDLAAIVGAHRTTLLKQAGTEGLTPLAAIQQYHSYAQEQLAAAAGGEVAGSMALYGLGKLYAVMGEQQHDDEIASARTKSMVLLQAAVIASPGNYMASNELGVLLARNGRHREARAAFQHSVATHPTAEGWRNLALTCERIGEMDVAYQAARQSLAMQHGTGGTTAPVIESSLGAVRWVAPADLAGTGKTIQTASAGGPPARTR